MLSDFPPIGKWSQRGESNFTEFDSKPERTTKSRAWDCHSSIENCVFLRAGSLTGLTSFDFLLEACCSGENHFTIDFHSDNSLAFGSFAFSTFLRVRRKQSLFLKLSLPGAYARKKDPSDGIAHRIENSRSVEIFPKSARSTVTTHGGPLSFLSRGSFPFDRVSNSMSLAIELTRRTRRLVTTRYNFLTEPSASERDPKGALRWLSCSLRLFCDCLCNGT